MSVYDYQATLADGTTYSLDRYRGKVLVIVNTATKCGFAPQFKQLEELYQDYKDQGVVVLGFPSDQFKQEVKSSQEAEKACRTTYGVTFPIHQIAKVNGDDALPLFNYLQTQKPGSVGKAIKWNFTKFLINQQGEVVDRFAPKTTPDKMKPAIEALLKK